MFIPDYEKRLEVGENNPVKKLVFFELRENNKGQALQIGKNYEF